MSTIIHTQLREQSNVLGKRDGYHPGLRNNVADGVTTGGRQQCPLSPPPRQTSYCLPTRKPPIASLHRLKLRSTLRSAVLYLSLNRLGSQQILGLPAPAIHVDSSKMHV